jgi:adenylyltransferase/sulfurtransferase
MSVTVYIPTVLRGATAGQQQVSATGATVREVLADIGRAHAGFLARVTSENGEMRPFLNVFVNGEDVRFVYELLTPVRDGDEISIIPSVAGGSPTAADLEVDEEVAAPLPELSAAEVLRYSRHLIIPEVGVTGQRKLKAARVLLVGAGGLGSPLGLYLAAAGVGTLGLVDFDVVDETNLQRQVLHGTKDVGRRKLDSALDRLRDVNPHTELIGHATRLDRSNALEILRDYDLVVDGTDNFPTRYLVNDACVLLGKPYVYGSIFRFEGQVSVFAAPGGPCYRCLFPEPPPPGVVPSCAEGGVLGVLPGIVGTHQALEALKLLLGIGEPLVGRLQTFDGLSMQWREFRLRRNPSCPICGEAPSIDSLIDYEEFCGVPQARAREAAERGRVPEITARELSLRLTREPITLLDVREPHEWEIANLAAHGARLIPLGQLAERLAEVDADRDVVVYCKGGTRSAKAAVQLRAAGIQRVWNLEGGILAWSADVDPTLPRY